MYCALRFGIALLISMNLSIVPRTAASCSVAISGRNEVGTIDLTSTQKQPLRVFAYDVEGGNGSEVQCEASITVPLSIYPTSRLVGRPSDFASELRDVLAAWAVTKCSVVVWIDNDTGDELDEEEQCLIETFRYQGDSVWSSGSEESCSSRWGS
jgi:hypothetical protein